MYNFMNYRNQVPPRPRVSVRAALGGLRGAVFHVWVREGRARAVHDIRFTLALVRKRLVRKTPGVRVVPQEVEVAGIFTRPHTNTRRSTFVRGAMPYHSTPRRAQYRAALFVLPLATYPFNIIIYAYYL
jgi:hypothetical protein